MLTFDIVKHAFVDADAYGFGMVEQETDFCGSAWLIDVGQIQFSDASCWMCGWIGGSDRSSLPGKQEINGGRTGGKNLSRILLCTHLPTYLLTP